MSVTRSCRTGVRVRVPVHPSTVPTSASATGRSPELAEAPVLEAMQIMSREADGQLYEDMMNLLKEEQGMSADGQSVYLPQDMCCRRICTTRIKASSPDGHHRVFEYLACLHPETWWSVCPALRPEQTAGGLPEMPESSGSLCGVHKFRFAVRALCTRKDRGNSCK